MNESSFYAGYGTNRDLVMIEAITGQKPHLVGTVYILDSGLWVQKMRQTPEIPIGDGLPTVRHLLTNNWGPEGEAHGIRGKIGSSVIASLIEVSPIELELIANWELVPHWKQREELLVRRSSTGQELTAFTEVLPDNQPVEREEHGLVYEMYLRNREELYCAAEVARLDYLRSRSLD